ncbi:hypothetical protein BKA59DRAFT_549043 [Fusarium tricinctum]|uniref:Uncharacterized protein n=1 Tax=Fusarium tricinctum TaxID=61284 RepID=A0A8K0RRC5_9HYPO|nr:hypothetical protein BKA59DRAFT_549043 [Fusarium tricinctum]
MNEAGGLSTQEINRIMDLEQFEFAEEWEWQDLNYINAIPPLIPYPSYCVSRRCGWCRFMIQPGEVITARSFGGTESSAFALGDAFSDSKLLATFGRCKSNHRSCASIGYHVECSTVASSYGLKKNDFSELVRYLYDPPIKEDKRRREWITNHLQQVLSREFAILPNEILFMVNKYLVRHYAIASLLCASLPGSCTIEPLKSVWADYFCLDGVEYIANLSNSPKPGSRLLWDAPSKREKNFLYISEDHLGVRQVINDSIDLSHEEQNNSGWWLTLPITSPEVIFYGDGLKLRGFAASPLTNISWQRPMSPAALKNTAYYAIKKPSSDFGKVDTARMEALYFNEPYTTGYSTCWSEGKLVDLHVHKSWETLDFYRELEEEKAERWPAVESKSALYWVYRPLNPGEYVEQVWLSARYEADDKSASSEDSRQSLDSKPCTRTAIAMITNHSRTLKMGKSSATHQDWKCITKTLTSSTMCVFLDPGLEGISFIAASTVDGSESDSLPADLSACVGKDADAGVAGCSEASLEDVEEIVICEEQLGKDTSDVSGMLFRYADGKQACVGKFRLDHMQPPLSVAGSKCLYIGIKTFDDGKSVVKRVVVSGPEPEEGLEWTKIPWKGNLVWRFTQEYSDVGLVLNN